MERWDSYYQSGVDGYPGTYTGASHLRFPGQEDSGTSSTGSLGDVFTSATECGAQCWTSSSSFPTRLDSESELSPPDSPLASELQVKLECALNRITAMLLPYPLLLEPCKC